MRIDPKLDSARWWKALGSCVGCGKPATGELMSDRNDRIGPYCERCANKRLKAAQKARAVK